MCGGVIVSECVVGVYLRFGCRFMCSTARHLGCGGRGSSITRATADWCADHNGATADALPLAAMYRCLIFAATLLLELEVASSIDG